MIQKEMTSLERVFTAISQKEPDRVPLMLFLSTYGARELGLNIKEYFKSEKNVVSAQIKMRKKYSNDCLYSFFYAPIEIEAWGGEVIFYDDGPPNSGEPFIKNFEQINNLRIPEVKKTPCLLKVLETTNLLKKEAGSEASIIGVVMSPFSIPIMQMGFEKYLDLLYFRNADFEKLMKINEFFCVSWANAQIEAGATAICYFNPLASPTIIDKNTYLKKGYQIDKRTLSHIKGPTATHLASGRAIPVLNELIDTGTLIAGISADEDLKDVKKSAKGKIALIGNLNALEMIHWDSATTEQKVKEAIAKGAIGGGFILSDNHGEIPWYVPEEVLLNISQAVQRWGRYPLEWANK